ncbi:MAG: transglycosylase SLT domain-containing protein, partial [Acidimicrobiales bacterium]
GASRRVTVALGQTLSAIAYRYGVTVAQLVAANDISDPNMVRAGSTLVIPGAVASSSYLSSFSGYLSSSSGLGGFGGPSAAVLDSSYGRALLADFSYWSAHYGVPANVIEALTWWESGWNNNEVSATGALGIGQLEPATVSYVNNVLLGGTRLDPSVPSENIRMTAAFLAHLIRHTAGNLGLAVAAYYQGLASIRARGEYHDTVHYVAGVMAYARVF